MRGKAAAAVGEWRLHMDPEVTLPVSGVCAKMSCRGLDMGNLYRVMH